MKNPLPFPTENIPTITVSPSQSIGSIKCMNAVNNGPSKPRPDQTSSNFRTYRAARIPFARIHDANWSSTYGAPHTVDITAIFPNFDADVNDPASYDFAMTDNYLKTIEDAGTEVFFRLGQSIEHGIKKYGIYPPKDSFKWAQICEHIIRHYIEGWNHGPKMKITYWEIWNEPDLRVPLDGVNVAADPKTWGGTTTQFFDLFRITACHLKKCFPNLKIGGPAIASRADWAALFLADMQKNNVPMDFFSWHCYTTDPVHLANRCLFFRNLLDQHGYTNCESVLDEYNYVLGWSSSWIYSLDVESGSNNLKGAAFTAACLSRGQDAPVDILMYYDARVACGMNGLFAKCSLAPLPGYYPFYAWSKLRDLGTQIKTSLEWNNAHFSDQAPDDIPDITATAAVSADGSKKGLFVTRYNNDNNVVWKSLVRIKLDNDIPFSEVRCHITDPHHIYTEVPIDIEPDGSIYIELFPNSFAFIEW